MKVRPKLLDSELATFARIRQILTAIFINGKKTDFPFTSESELPIVNGDPPIVSRRLQLSINDNGDPVPGGDTTILLEQENGSNIVIEGIEGKEHLPGERIPIVFKMALSKVNESFQTNTTRRGRIAQSLDPREIDRVSPDRKLRNGEVT